MLKVRRNGLPLLGRSPARASVQAVSCNLARRGILAAALVAVMPRPAVPSGCVTPALSHLTRVLHRSAPARRQTATRRPCVLSQEGFKGA